jgi:hypothetical protein
MYRRFSICQGGRLLRLLHGSRPASRSGRLRVLARAAGSVLRLRRDAVPGLESRQLAERRAFRARTAERHLALALFRSAGYEEIAPFTDGAFTRHWLAKIVA